MPGGRPVATIAARGGRRWVVASDFFLKVDGIPGESQDHKHKGEIELASFNWGVSQTSPGSAGAGGGAGKAVIQDLHFLTLVSKASPLLFLSCATGKHLKQATLTARKAGKEQHTFLTIDMRDVMVSQYQISGSEGAGPPMDQVSFNFARIVFEYRPQKADGTLDAPVKVGWDVKKNKQI
jgi:type VI secretion system secreted protein Hcp